MIPAQPAPSGCRPRALALSLSGGSPGVAGRRRLGECDAPEARAGSRTVPAGGSGSDEQLVALVRGGQGSAFDKLVARYQVRLLWFCWQMLRSKEDAEDALQEVFAAAFNAILASEHEIQVRPWLYRIARNRCISQLRRARTVAVDSLDDRYAENGRTLVEQLVNRQALRDLVSDVQALPATQRTALLLREIDGFSYEEIAVGMDTTVPGVKSLLVRARAGLRDSATVRDAMLTARRRGLSRARPRRGSRTLSYRAARAGATAARRTAS
jgi:RNA polymerase sigma factor (sigma-70 family)